MTLFMPGLSEAVFEIKSSKTGNTKIMYGNDSLIEAEYQDYTIISVFFVAKQQLVNTMIDTFC